MSLAERAPAHVRGISPYVPGKPLEALARETGLRTQDVIKLASNENPLGMSPGARAAMESALGELQRYPDGGGFALKAELARAHGVPPEAIVLGNGSGDVLELAARAFLAPDASAVCSQYAFAVYPLAVMATGARLIEVPARAWGHDIAALGDAIAADTRVVFIANPNNPTGTFLPAALIEAFLARVPGDVLVVLDEAYVEYLPDEVRYDSVAWLARHPNLLVTRTFSKIHGLAGLRVGYALAHPDVAALLDRVRQPFNVNVLAQVAACGALADTAFVARSRAANREGMRQIVAGLDALNLRHIPSLGNFVSFHVGDAARVDAALQRRGVIVRPLASYAMPAWLRVTVGSPGENARFLDALERALKE
ncbi:MAG: histidinol-phosphate transaminase [Candidatus Dactylopiibacterium sp.]|nr:histidinol-phosphate transaminase [Candidatus Dactylopiibacterium sp.]